ncbi:sodium/bile acid cotransporter 5-like [Diorhabda carinulata]|uniref:sodium/bile acid cotransporter 5-like n=1 Tax=Diorhabda carinulata TaxID=1163345 RepID=UPI0025A13996|nr:sodium/bile acid cotransporter 5-like [Diorhabda carinulata]
MCPISGLVQFLIVLVTLILICHAVIVKSCNITFNPQNATIHMYDTIIVDYDASNQDGGDYTLYSEDENVASLDKEYLITNDSGSFNVTGNFLGKTVISCKKRGSSGKSESTGNMDIVVIRKKRVIDTMFTASVATLISLLYINFGCAIDWSEFRTILKRPIGPGVGLFGHFVVMPALSYAFGVLLFPDNAAMQLGLFFTGVSPAGGASNVWAILLEGNISLSISMTFVSTMAAFAFMPLWIFTLGRVIFRNAKLEVPYTEIMTYVVALIIPLTIGYLIQRYLKRVANFMVRIIKGFSTLLILFIIVFAIVTNLYLFKLFSWQIIVAGMGIPWLGYVAGYLISKLLRQNPVDCLTMAIEIGIQNTGIAIFLLRFALPQPEADLTTVAPVAVAVLTPFPLLLLFVVKKLRSRLHHSHSKLSQEEIVKSENTSNSINGIDINGIS